MKADAGLNLKKRKLLQDIYNARYLYILILPAIAYYIIFHYLPIAGITLAFKEYKANLGILGSPWVGLKNYEFVFKDPMFYKALVNTFIISFERILFQFPMPVVLAVMLSEVRNRRLLRPLQTTFTFPHFLSWVVVGGILVNFLGEYGAVNNLLVLLGLEKQSFLSNQALFRPILYITQIWKGAGWASIMYLASIVSIPPELYEAAAIDGATRMQRIRHVTLPGIKSTIVVLLILNVGQVMDMGFDQIFNLQNPAVQDVSEILGTYIYRITFSGPMDFGFSTAIGLFKSVVNFIFLLTADQVVKLMGEKGLFS